METIYQVDKKARLIINDLNYLEVQCSAKCCLSNEYFWKSVGKHKNTINGMHKALAQYYATIIYKTDKELYYKATQIIWQEN